MVYKWFYNWLNIGGVYILKCETKSYIKRDMKISMSLGDLEIKQ